jgi:hypothetical protein
MDTPEPRTARVLRPPPRRRRPRPYLAHLDLPPDLRPDPVAPAASVLLLHRALSGLRALPDAPPAAPDRATLADLTRRLLARDPSLGAPPEEREPSPDVVVTQELPVVGGPVVPAQGGGR